MTLGLTFRDSFAHRGEVLDLVHEDDGRRERRDPLEALSQELGLALFALSANLRRLDLDERPLESRRDPLGERRLAGPRRAEEDDCLRRDNAVPASQLRALEREDDTALDDLLRVLHPAQLGPKAGRDHSATDIGECLPGQDALGEGALEKDGVTIRPVLALLELRPGGVPGREGNDVPSSTLRDLRL